MNDLAKEEADIAVEMCKCFKTAVGFSKINRLDSLDDESKTTLKKHLKNMYGLDISIWHYDQESNVTYDITRTDNNRIYNLRVKTGWWAKIHRGFFSPDVTTWEMVHFNVEGFWRVFKSLEEELEYKLDKYFREYVNRVQLLNENSCEEDRPLQDKIEYCTNQPPMVVYNPPFAVIPDADVREVLFEYFVKSKTTKEKYRVLIECVSDYRTAIPLLYYRTVHVSNASAEAKATIKSELEKLEEDMKKDYFAEEIVNIRSAKIIHRHTYKKRSECKEHNTHLEDGTLIYYIEHNPQIVKLAIELSNKTKGNYHAQTPDCTRSNRSSDEG